ncbi:MAG: aquaporin [Candidatus Nomurabacteria bacterium]|jgi:glycerol uptake facilitator-like aquaporin|nr:aquaporin [Candidatus Nomurabacteria bacterium]
MATTKAKSTAARKKAPAKKKPATSRNSGKSVSAVAEIKKTEKNENKMPRIGALIAEFVGAFVLTGAFITLFAGGVEGHIGIALTLIALVVIFAIISRAHFNPAVTLALWANRKFGGIKTILYIVVQCFGAAVAWLVFRAFFAANAGIGLVDSNDSMIIAALSERNVTQEAIDQAGGLLEFAKANNFASIAAMADFLNVKPFASLEANGLVTFFSELMAAIVFGFGAGFAYLAKHKKPLVRGVVLGFAMFVGLTIGGAGVVLNPAIAAAIGAFNLGAFEISSFMWSIVIYVVATVAGVLVGLTAYRFIRKNACDCDDCGDKCDCGCHE